MHMNEDTRQESWDRIFDDGYSMPRRPEIVQWPAIFVLFWRRKETSARERTGDILLEDNFQAVETCF